MGQVFLMNSSALPCKWSLALAIPETHSKISSKLEKDRLGLSALLLKDNQGTSLP